MPIDPIRALGGLLGAALLLQGCDSFIERFELESTAAARRAQIPSPTPAPTAAPTYNYEYVQQVGLYLDTLPDSIFGRDAYAGIINVDPNGRNVVDNVEDAEIRTEVMKKMMSVAYESAHWDNSTRVLKVFMAPEFFFRGANGAYDIEKLADCSDANATCSAPIISILESLREEVKSAKWNDWLFVFGTIVAHSFKEDQYFNFAPIMRGGPNGVNKHHIIAKTHISRVDFIGRESIFSRTGNEVVLPYSDGKYDLFSEIERTALTKEGFTLDDGNVFVIDGIRFGVEVSYDHPLGALQSKLNGEPVQVHLVTSAGVRIFTDKAVNYDVASGTVCGPVFLQDGGNQGTQYYCDGCSYLKEGSLAGYGSSYVRRVQHSPTSSGGYEQESTDPRIDTDLWDDVFAEHRFKPVINISPALQVNQSCF